MTEKVEVTVGGNSVEVDQKFYRIAMGILTMGVPVMDVFEGYAGDDPDVVAQRAEDEANGTPNDFVSIVFPDADSMEFFSGFLLQHGLFPDSDGELQVGGSFCVEMIDGDLCTTYFISVDPAHLSSLEACLVSHTPSLSSEQN
jgi:hypothetical protein